MPPINKWPRVTYPTFCGHAAAVPIPDLGGDDSELEPAEQREDIEQLPAQQQREDIEQQLTGICRQFSAVELGEEDPDAKRCRAKKKYTEPAWHEWIEHRIWMRKQEGLWYPWQMRNWERKHRVEAHKDSKELWNMFLNESEMWNTWTDELWADWLVDLFIRLREAQVFVNQHEHITKPDAATATFSFDQPPPATVGTGNWTRHERPPAPDSCFALSGSGGYNVDYQAEIPRFLPPAEDCSLSSSSNDIVTEPPLSD